MNVQIAYLSNDQLGEGPVWVPEEQALYWIDIQRPALQRWHPQSAEYRFWQLPSEIGSFALRKQGGAVLALRTGFAYLDLETAAITPLADPEADLPFTRFNDGKCDRRGRFWAGTMDEEIPNTRGALYRLDPGGAYLTMQEGIGISNGLGWSPDNRTMYYTDSIKHQIYAYDFDLESGTIRNRRVFAETPEAYVPDGLAVDAEGYIWSAKWDGWKVVRYAPDGSVDLEVPLPVQRPTSCAFGGPDLKHLYITSARVDLSAKELAEQPQAGSIFVVKTTTQGLPEPRFQG
ncbi:MAG TPA: gluconolactonase [Chloroflexi bacterium]|nr:gluconolactonase [Chloroflexota bacterium]